MELEKTNERLADETGARRRESSSRISPRKSMQQPHADTGHPSVAAGTSAATGESLEQIKGRDAANQSEDFRVFFLNKKRRRGVVKRKTMKTNIGMFQLSVHSNLSNRLEAI